MLRSIFNRWIVLVGFVIGFYFGQQILFHYCLKQLSVDEDISIYRTYFYEHFQYKTNSTCHVNRMKPFLTVAILSSFERLTVYLPAIIQTWLLTTTVDVEIIVFLEEQSQINQDYLNRYFFSLINYSNISSCFYIVQLKHVQNEYPPQKKSFYAMKYLYTFYSSRTSWILRLDDNAYVNIPRLIPWLKSLDHEQIFYIGQGGNGRRQGPAIYFPPGKYFCMGGSGVILSQQTLIQLGPWLDYCFEHELLTIHEDVELGRCILTHVEISCTNAFDSKTYFYHHYGPNYEFGTDFTSKILSQAFILHPIKDFNTFIQIYYFYQRQSRQLTTWKSTNLINYITFSHAIEFDLIRDIQYQKLDVRWKDYLQTTVRTYLDNLNKIWYQRSSNWTVLNGQYFFGYRRVLPTVGLEMFIEILLNIRLVNTTRSNLVRKRIHLQQAFVKHLDYREVDVTNDRLNIIVVAHNRDQALERFIRNFQHENLDETQFSLTILYFSHFNSNVQQFRQLIQRFSSPIRLIYLDEKQYKYNRGFGRQIASKYFYSNDILLYLDVDIMFTRQSLINTRRLMNHKLKISNCSVYFPIIFSKYSNLSNETNCGIFSIYGFGNVAMKKSDLEQIGGWQTNNFDWGDEDVNLFSKFLDRSLNCQVIRTVEPNFVHSYHRKMCENIENQSREKMCVDAQANLLGSSIDMINYINKNKLV